MSSKEFIDKTDFDIENYNVEELINILGLGQEIPLTNEKIVTTISEFKKKFNSNDKLVNQQKKHFTSFFDEIQRKLLKYKKNETVNDLFDEKIKTKITYTPNIVNDRNPKKNMMLPKDVISEQRIIGLENVNKLPFESFSTDYKNPLQRNIIKRLVTIDSAFRSIPSETSVACPGEESNINSTNKRLETSTNFTVNLVPPLKNVMEIAFDSAYIPHTWWTFAGDYGTDFFLESEEKTINGTINFEFPIKRVIKSGNYPDGNTISQELNNKSSYFDFSYDAIQDKVTVRNQSSQTRKIIWYSQQVPFCSITGFGGKLDYNLGWLLGFRNKEYILKPNQFIIGESILDLVGTTYAYILLDDFNNNKPNQDLVSFTNNVQNFNMPSYYVRTTMKPGEECLVEPDPPRNNCGKKYANKDLSSNLTSAQRYTIDQIRLAMAGKKADRYNSPNSSDVFRKIQLNLPPSGRGKGTSVVNITHDYTKRIYFGPITLRKLKIKLVNDKGIPLNLNGRDWSFSFYVKSIYQN